MKPNTTFLKAFFLGLLFWGGFQQVQAQTGIGTTAPHASAQLEVKANDKGILIPRMTTSERNAINSPAKGLMVYDTNDNAFWYYDGNRWISIINSGQSNESSMIIGESSIPSSGLISLLHNVLITDTSGIIYDSGGDNFNYNNNENYSTYLFNSLAKGYKLIVNYNIAVGDTLKISATNFSNISKFYTNGSGTDTFYIDLQAAISFTSNASGTAPGFTIYYNAIFEDTTTNIAPSVIGGWYYRPNTKSISGGTNIVPNESLEMGKYSLSYGNGSKASGQASTAMGEYSIASGTASTAMGSNNKASASYSTAMGSNNTASASYSTAMGSNNKASASYSTAMGSNNTASGGYSTAMGSNNTASGTASTVMGYENTASGYYSTAMGYENTASGTVSTAMGYYNTASGYNSTAMGYYNTASGIRSTAMGSYVSTNSKQGSFIIGDSRTTVTESSTNNQMTMRFGGGYRFFTGSTGDGSSSGVTLAAGGNSWASISDSTKKENFKYANGSEFLNKIKKMKIGSWNYKGQDKTSFRHYGPMAQEFYAYFGNDGIGTIGNDTTIASADIDGVMMIAIQELIKENEALKAENKEMKAELNIQKTNSALREAEINERLERLEILLNKTEVAKQ